MPHLIHRHSLHDAWHTKAVVTMEMTQAQSSHTIYRDTGQRQLALTALPRIEQQPLAVPAQQVSVVVAMTSGHLTGGTEHDQLPDRHRSRVRPVIVPSGL